MFSIIFGNICTKPGPIRSGVLSAAALLSIVLTVVFSILARHPSFIDTLNSTRIGAASKGLFGAIGAFGSVYFFITMLYHCVRCAALSKKVKLVWVILFFVVGPIGPIVYYLSVFLPGWREVA